MSFFVFLLYSFFFFKQKTAYEIMPSLVGSEMCIRDRAALLPIAVHAQRLGVYSLSLTAIVAMILVLFASTIWLRGPSGKPLSSVAITAFGVMLSLIHISE